MGSVCESAALLKGAFCPRFEVCASAQGCLSEVKTSEQRSESVMQCSYRSVGEVLGCEGLAGLSECFLAALQVHFFLPGLCSPMRSVGQHGSSLHPDGAFCSLREDTAAPRDSSPWLLASRRSMVQTASRQLSQGCWLHVLDSPIFALLCCQPVPCSDAPELQG